MELELTKTEKYLLVAFILVIAFFVLRKYYSKKKQESSYQNPIIDRATADAALKAKQATKD